MKKTLRISLVALFATLCNVAFAADIIWSEDFSSYAKNDVPAGGEFSYVCVGSGTKIYNENLAGGEVPELLIGKSGGSFSVTIPMNGKSGEMTLAFKANYDRITVTAVDATLGDKVVSGNDYMYPVTVAAGVEEVTLTFTNSTSSNVRFDNARLFQGEAKKPAGLSWGTASRDVTIGSENNKFPTLTNANNLPIVYSSDNTEVATIDAEGNITLVAAGSTNISASFEGNDEFEASTVSYKLNVKAPADPSEDISNTPETAYTVARALELITEGKGLDSKVYV
ncbi:MAG: Ig-like domain-containing protein, partial [Muribaculaceae bacterium]